MLGFDKCNKKLKPFAAYFGVIAASLALGSWITSNYIGVKAKSASDSLYNAEREFQLSKSFRSITAFVLEDSQRLDQVYGAVRKGLKNKEMPADISEDRYDEMLRLEYVRHNDRFVLLDVERAKRLVELVEIINLNDDALRNRAKSVYENILSFWEKREASREELKHSFQNAGDVYKLSESEWRELESSIDHYRELVEIKLIPEQNQISHEVASLETEILNVKREEMRRRKTLSTSVNSIAFALYLISAILALYGKWLEVKFPSRAEPENKKS